MPVEGMRLCLSWAEAGAVVVDKRELRAKLWRTRRDALMAALGYECAICGAWEDLEFDHPNGRDYDVARLNRWTRLKRYEKDYQDGNLRLLCKTHNARDGGRRRHAKR